MRSHSLFAWPFTSRAFPMFMPNGHTHHNMRSRVVLPKTPVMCCPGGRHAWFETAHGRVRKPFDSLTRYNERVRDRVAKPLKTASVRPDILLLAMNDYP